MKTFTRGYYLIFLLVIFSCRHPQIVPANSTIRLIPKDTSVKYERENKLFVFVGEKISVTPLPHEKGSMDAGFKAKYKIIQRVYGSYPKNTIEFEAYDHYGTPAFSRYQHVILYVSEYQGKLYHEKYQYDPVFKTKSGRWAGPYSNDYGHSYNTNTMVKPEKIDFAEEVSFPLRMQGGFGKEFTADYPEPYYKITGDRAVVVYGNYVEELFLLKKVGVLTARKLFGNERPDEE